MVRHKKEKKEEKRQHSHQGATAFVLWTCLNNLNGFIPFSCFFFRLSNAWYRGISAWFFIYFIIVVLLGKYGLLCAHAHVYSKRKCTGGLSLETVFYNHYHVRLKIRSLYTPRGHSYCKKYIPFSIYVFAKKEVAKQVNSRSKMN